MRSLLAACCLAAAALAGAPAPFLVAALTASPARAEARADDPAILIEKSGLDAVFETLDLEFRRAASSDEMDVDPALQTAWASASVSLKLGERLSASMAEGLAELLDATEVAEIAGFYDAPLGRRIVEAERAALGPEADAAIESEGPALLAALKQDPARWAEHEAVIENSGSAEIGIEIFASMMTALLTGMTAVEDGFERLDRADIEAVVAAQVAELRPELEAEIERAVAYTYRDFGADELARYNAFLTSRAGRKFFAVTVGVFGQTLADEMYRFGAALATALEHKDI